MKITSEKDLRESIRKEMTALAKAAARIVEEKEPDQDFDPTKIPGIPKKLVKLLDPSASPQKFAKLDAELDEKGSKQHQAFALLAFALTYADNDVRAAQGLLKIAASLGPKVQKKLESAKGKKDDTDQGDEEGQGEKSGSFSWKQ